jgi:hypothetical protein
LSTSSIYLYYGSGKPKEEIPVKRKEESYDKIIDVLNDLESKGYKFVASDTHAYSPANRSDAIVDRSVVGVTYTLRKIER